MTTTAILVEILIIGIQASFWVSLVIVSVFGFQWVPAVCSAVKGWEPLLTFLALGVCYTFGIFVDRVADCLSVLYHPGDALLRFRWIKRNADAAHSDMRMKLLCAEDSATEFLAQIRSRIRIARATVLNLILVTLATLFFFVVRTQTTSFGTLSLIAFSGVGLCFVSFLGLGVLEVTYFTRLKQAKRYLEADEQEILNGEKWQITNRFSEREPTSSLRGEKRVRISFLASGGWHAPRLRGHVSRTAAYHGHEDVAMPHSHSHQ